MSNTNQPVIALWPTLNMNRGLTMILEAAQRAGLPEPKDIAVEGHQVALFFHSGADMAAWCDHNGVTEILNYPFGRSKLVSARCAPFDVPVALLADVTVATGSAVA